MEGRVGREALPEPPPGSSLRVWSPASGVLGSEEVGGRRARSGRRAEGAGDLLVKGPRSPVGLVARLGRMCRGEQASRTSRGD
jgi:hypothetical protein